MRRKDETVNHIIREYNKLAKKEYKTRHDWVRKMIRWELCKRLKFDHINKWYMLKPESVQEKETHKILWDFDHPIPARRPDLVLINKKKKKKTCPLMGFVVSAHHREKITENETIE